MVQFNLSVAGQVTNINSRTSVEIRISFYITHRNIEVIIKIRCSWFISIALQPYHTGDVQVILKRSETPRVCSEHATSAQRTRYCLAESSQRLDAILCTLALRRYRCVTAANSLRSRQQITNVTGLLLLIFSSYN